MDNRTVKGAEEMIIAITIILIVLIICATTLIYVFIENSDGFSIWKTERYLKQILKNQEEILERLKEQS